MRKIEHSKETDILNQRFTKLVIQKYSHRRDGNIYYKCQCDCGKIKTLERSDILFKRVKSCGCLKKSKYKYYKIDGKIKNLSEWCRYYQINFSTVCNRLKAGVPIKYALSAKVSRNK